MEDKISRKAWEAQEKEFQPVFEAIDYFARNNLPGDVAGRILHEITTRYYHNPLIGDILRKFQGEWNERMVEVRQSWRAEAKDTPRS